MAHTKNVAGSEQHHRLGTTFTIVTSNCQVWELDTASRSPKLLYCGAVKDRTSIISSPSRATWTINQTQKLRNDERKGAFGCRRDPRRRQVRWSWMPFTLSNPLSGHRAVDPRSIHPGSETNLLRLLMWISKLAQSEKHPNQQKLLPLRHPPSFPQSRRKDNILNAP